MKWNISKICKLKHFLDKYSLDCRKRAERLSTQTKVDEKDVEAATKQTAQDFVDQCQRQLAQFQFGSKSFGPGELLDSISSR